MTKVGLALTTGHTGDAPAGPAVDAMADGPTDAAGAAAGAAPAAAAAPGATADSLAVKPQAFKSLVGKGHPEFSSNRQQVTEMFCSCGSLL